MSRVHGAAAMRVQSLLPGDVCVSCPSFAGPPYGAVLSFRSAHSCQWNANLQTAADGGWVKRVALAFARSVTLWLQSRLWNRACAQQEGHGGGRGCRPAGWRGHVC